MPLVPGQLLGRVRHDVGRNLRRARNGLRHLSEVGRPEVATSPRQLVWERDKARLWRYDASGRRDGAPVLLVMSLVTRPHVFDLRPGSSLVESLLNGGFDVFLLDWGVPDAADAANGLETYCDEYLPGAVRCVAASSAASDVTVLGYCLGGVLSLLTVAGHPQLPVGRLVVLATPIDFSTFGPLVAMLGSGRVDPVELLDATGNVPAEVMLNGLKLLTPTADLGSVANLWLNLDDRRYLESYQALIGWSRDHIPFPGRAFRQVAELLVRDGCLLDGRVPVGGRTVELAAITCPVLSVTGELDHLVPPASSDPLPALVPNATVDELRVRAGHAGLFIGRQAQAGTVATMVQWIERHTALPDAGSASCRQHRS